jgi:hypothetical protein
LEEEVDAVKTELGHPPAENLTVGITTQALQTWLVGNAVTVVVVIIAVALLVRALKGDAGKVLTVMGLSICGLLFLALGTVPGAAAGVGKWALGLLGIGAG